MEVIEIKTLIDITNTNVRRINQGTQQELDQFRNWTTLMQSIGLRAIIEYDKEPIVEIGDVEKYRFGSNYTGQHRIWTFYFRPDRVDAFAKDSDPIYLLKQDLDQIPIILNLTETINTERAVFDLTDPKAMNTIVRKS